MDFLNRIQTQAATFWEQLDPRRRWTFVITLASLAVGFTALLLWANQTDYAQLYTAESPEVAAEIVQKLKEQQVDYRLSRGGTVIEVPRDQVLDLRLSLAGEGVPRNGTVGFEIFDNPTVSATNFVEQLNYQRALQGELQRTINEMDNIESSRVLLAIPRDTLFIEDTKPPTASVVLKTKNADLVRRNHIKAISNLVASAVEGMSPDDVTITDTNGKLLSSPKDDSVAGMPSSLLEYKEIQERKLEGRIVELLEQTTGPGKVRAMVTAELDMTAQEEVTERYDGDSAVPRSIQRRTEDREATVPGPEGAPGTNANLPNSTTNTLMVQRNVIGKVDETTNYEIDKTVRTKTEKPGQLSRLSVTVLVDGTYNASGEEKVWVARTADEQAAFESAVKGAIGFNEERGDVVQIINVPFHSFESELASTKSLEWQSPARYALMLLGMVLLFFLARPLIVALTTERADLGRAGEEGMLAAGANPALLDAAYADGGYGFEGDALGLPDGQRLLTAGNNDRQRREEMINLARSDMENTVNTLREWLQEEPRQSA